jgi:uncharacterized protein (DUF433 family)/DNA-binding transcriptional MerR regulator
MPDVDNLLGIGIYSLGEASKIARVPSSSIRRWLWGYNYRVSGQQQQSAAALWTPQLPSLDGSRALTFRDLIELQFVHRFRQVGISLQSIRRTIDLATKLLDETYPLSSVKFKTDGRRVLAQVVDNPDERGYIFDLETGQYLFEFVLEYLYDALEYSELDELVRWWPLGKNRHVLVDPRRSFGRPIVTEGVPTAILAGSFKAEGSVEAVAKWFEVSTESVQDALELERSRAAA